MQPFSHTSMNSYIFSLYFGLESNTVPFILCSNCSSFDHWELFQSHSCVPLTYPLLLWGSTTLLSIPWMEEPGGLQSTELQRVGHDWATSLLLPYFFTLRYSRLILYFPVLESAISPGTLGSFCRRMNGLRKQAWQVLTDCFYCSLNFPLFPIRHKPHLRLAVFLTVYLL